MKTLYSCLSFTAVALLFSACRPEIKTPAPTHGSADFSRYIAVGNSLTSGYADGGLYLAGQLNSYPSIIAKQMQQAGGGSFSQPLFTAGKENGSGYIQLTGFNADGTPVTKAVTSNLAIRGQVTLPASATTSTNVTLYTKYTGDINNYGIPGIKLYNITTSVYGNYNGFFERLLPANSPNNTTTYLDFVTAKPFTFFTDWLGNNDALAYATSGGAGDVLTDKAIFAQLYTASVAKLTAAGQKGAVATIPDVTTIPYFTTVTTSAILAGVQKASPTVKAIYINAKSSADATSTAYATRAATAGDLFILTFPTSLIGQNVPTPVGPLPYGLTPYTPIDSKYVLDQNEVSMVQDYVTSYNNTIKSVAASKNLAVFDAFTLLGSIKASGMTINGVSVNSNYISGGLFSLDGIHLTPRGYAIIADEFIMAINKQYGATIPLADVSQYNGVKFP